MRTRIIALFLGGLLALMTSGFSPVRATVPPPHYRNCTALHRARPYGVAKSRKAANKQVNSGHYRPYVNFDLYAANSGLDRDKDGTACEVSR